VVRNIHTAEVTGSIPVSPTTSEAKRGVGVGVDVAEASCFSLVVCDTSYSWSAPLGPFKRHGGFSPLGLFVQPPSLIPVPYAPRPHCVHIRGVPAWVVGVGEVGDLGRGEEPLLRVLNRDGSSRHTADRSGVAGRVCVKDRITSFDSPRQHRAKRTMPRGSVFE
jgi:hypothetical protein